MTNTLSNTPSTESNNTFKKSMLDEKYEVLNELGSGFFGEVYKVLDTQTQKIYAAKIFKNKNKISKIDVSSFEQEEKNFRKINELDINSCIKFINSGIGTFIKDDKAELRKYIIMEYASNGDLFTKIDKTSHGFSEDVCKYLLYEIVKGVKELHNKGISHRDLKPQNFLLVGDELDLKICDFGSVVSFLKENNKKKLLEGLVGTPSYVAPEIIRLKPYNGEKIDIFSIGVTLFNLMTKMTPFQSFTNNFEFNQSIYKLIALNKIDEYWDNIEKHKNMKSIVLSKEFKELFIKMIEYNPKKRITLDEIMNSEWMKDIKNASEEYLQMLRNKMISEMKNM